MGDVGKKEILKSLINALENVMVLSRSSPKRFYPKAIIPIVVVAMTIIGSIWYGIANWGKKLPVSMYGENIYGTIPGISLLLVFCLYASKPYLLLNSMELLKNYEEFGKPHFLKQRNKFINLYVNVAFYGTSFTGFIYMVVGIFGKAECEHYKQELDLKVYCGFGSFLYYPLNIDYIVLKQVLVLMHLWAVWNIFNAGALFCHTAVAFIEHVIIKIEHLSEIVSDIFGSETLTIEDDEDKQKAIQETYRKRLVMCIKYHQHIIELVTVVGKCLRYIIILHLAISSFVISVCLLNFMSEITFKPISFLLAYMSSTFIVCFAGQRLIDKSNELCASIYNSRWYKAEVSIQKDVLFMLMRSQKELNIKAIITTLSYNTFMSIISTAYSYWTVIQKHEKQ